MKYRDAKLLHNGDQVTRKDNEEVLTINSVEVYGQYKKVKLNCLTSTNSLVSLFHDEIK